ncbi:MAG: type II secretion system F family protein [Bdellovibrionales bacterium]|nr:type II secretion system F family protein [Bdellovibrionales bacterium]
MGDLILIAGLLLIGIAIYLVSNVFLSTSEENAALSWASGDEPNKSKSKFVEISRPLVHRFCLTLVSKIKAPSYRESVEKKIAVAGLSSEINVNEFIGMQILWGLLFPVLLAFLNFSLQLGYSPVVVAIIGLFGAYFPHMHVGNERKRRYRSVVIDLPFFVDLLALSTQAAGMDFISAIQRVVEKAENSVLADELGGVLRDIKIGSSRDEALRAMADRLDIPEVTSFVVVVIDSEASGTPVGDVLKQQSAQMRMERLARAEKAGARASQMIFIPMMFIIFPAILIMVLGPAIISIFSGGS